MIESNWIRAGSDWSFRCKSVRVSGYYLLGTIYKGGVVPLRADDAFVEKIDHHLKAKFEGLPNDATLIMWFYEAHRNEIVLRYVHRSFDEVPHGHQIPELDLIQLPTSTKGIPVPVGPQEYQVNLDAADARTLKELTQFERERILQAVREELPPDVYEEVKSQVSKLRPMKFLVVRNK